MVALVSAVSKDPIIAADAQVELLFDSTGALTRINAKTIVTVPCRGTRGPKRGPSLSNKDGRTQRSWLFQSRRRPSSDGLL
jgi:hypothetical protein